MTTQAIKVSTTFQAIGDGTKSVLIEAQGGDFGWTDASAPDATTPVHNLRSGESILLPAGINVQVMGGGGTCVYTIYP